MISQERRRQFFRNALVGLAVVAAVLLLFRDYFGQTLLFGDSNLQWDRGLIGAAVSQLGHSWATVFGAGRTSIIFNESTSPLTVLQAALSIFGVPLSTLLIYPTLLIVAYAGAWTAARRISGSGALAAHAVAIFYIGNPWIWDRVLLGHIAILSAVAVTPWLIAAVAYRAKLGLAFLPAVCIGAALILACDPRIAYLVFAGLVALGVLWLVRAASGAGPGDRYGVATVFVAPCVAFVANAWWTFPYLFLPGVNPVRAHYPPLEDVLSSSRYSDLWHNLVFSGSFLHFSWDRAAAFGLGFALWYLAVLAVVAAALTARPRSAALGWTLRAGVVASIVLSFGTSLLPNGALLWAYQHVPFAMLFRDPNKIGFVAIACCTALLCIRFRDARPAFSRALLVAIAISAFPAATGTLQTSDGTGLQAFASQPDYAAVLGYLRARPDFPQFRLGLIPAWSAEVSLGGLHPVANPFVFQYDVPTMDAKLISVGSDTNMEAWRVYRLFYEGRDPHVGAEFARLGVAYLLWDESASPSAGAQNTTFLGATSSVIRAATAIAGFPEVFRSGPLHLYRNPEAGPLVRTLAGPVVAGGVAQAVRAQLPAAAFGDTVEATDDGALPFASFGIGADREDACRSRLPRSAMTMAVDGASGRADWSSNWVDDEYVEQGTGDAFLGRRLERYPLPYAFTASNAVIDFPVDVPRGGRLTVQGAVLAVPAATAYRIDGGAWRPLALSPTLRWIAIETPAPGGHVLTIRGSRVGTVLRAVSAAPAAGCSGPYVSLASGTPSAAGSWTLPGPISMLVLRSKHGAFSYDAVNAASHASGPIEGPGADAILLDRRASIVGQPVPVLTGLHAVQFFAAGAPFAAPRWSHALRGGPTGEAPVPTIALSQTYSQDGAIANIAGVPVGSTVLVRVPWSGDPRSTDVRISESGLVIARYPLASAANWIAAPVYADTVSIDVERIGPGGALRIGTPEARAGVVLAESALRVPADTTAASSKPVIAAPSTRAARDLVLAADDRSLAPKGAIVGPIGVNGAGAIVTYDRLRATPTTCSLDVTFESAFGPVTRAVAEFALDARGASGTIDVAFPPRTTGVSPAFTCADQHALVALDRLSIASYDRPSDPAVVRFVGTPGAAKPVPIAVAISSNEAYTISGRSRDVVSLSSYDPAWIFEKNRHLLIDGTFNGWVRAGGSAVVYTTQSWYVRFLLLSAVVWLLMFAGLVASALRSRRT